jgi:hypothetical protein
MARAALGEMRGEVGPAQDTNEPTIGVDEP